jgi:hypothetical protein
MGVHDQEAGGAPCVDNEGELVHRGHERCRHTHRGEDLIGGSADFPAAVDDHYLHD